MNRVLIVGCSGSGKSTLARKMGAATGLPVFHLDTLYWQRDWKPHPDEPAFQATVRDIARQDRWIIDGGFTTGTGEVRFSRADTVVLFDLNRRICLWRAIKRYLTYRGVSRPDMAHGCEERFDLEFYRYIWSYRTKHLPRLLAYADAHFSGELIRIRNGREQADVMQRFSTTSVSPSSAIG